MGLTVTVLGSSGSYAGPGQACSSYLVQGGGASMWLDAGNGSLANLQRHIALDSIDAVVLTHEHPDHVCDIEGFWVACRFVLGRQGLPVYAPRSVRQHLYHANQGPELGWHDVAEGDRVEVAGLRITFSRTDHGPETLAVRVDQRVGEGGDVEGASCSVGYSADSGPGWSLEALGPGLDLALCEATLPQDHEGKVPGHMSARQAAMSGREAGVRRLVLTHLWPTVDAQQSRREGAEAFGIDVGVARLDDRYEV